MPQPVSSREAFVECEQLSATAVEVVSDMVAGDVRLEIAFEAAACVLVGAPWAT